MGQPPFRRGRTREARNEKSKIISRFHDVRITRFSVPENRDKKFLSRPRVALTFHKA
jgi:hypothetical protein